MLGSLDTSNRQVYLYLTHIHIGVPGAVQGLQNQKVILLTLLGYTRFNNGAAYKLVLVKYRANQIKSTNQKNTRNQGRFVKPSSSSVMLTPTSGFTTSLVRAPMSDWWGLPCLFVLI